MFRERLAIALGALLIAASCSKLLGFEPGTLALPNLEGGSGTAGGGGVAGALNQASDWQVCRERECSAPADPACTNPCRDACITVCSADPATFDCAALCEQDCGTSCGSLCQTDCQGDANCQAACEPACARTCEGECGICRNNADPACEVTCAAKCDGQCSAQANMPCQARCQTGGLGIGGTGAEAQAGQTGVAGSGGPVGGSTGGTRTAQGGTAYGGGPPCASPSGGVSGGSSNSTGGVNPPSYINVTVCSDLVENGNPACRSACIVCCGKAGYADNSFIYQRACTCGNTPKSPSNTTVCAGSGASAIVCGDCCSENGFANGTLVNGACSCSGTRDSQVCAWTLSVQPSDVACTNCCIGQGYLGLDYAAAIGGPHCTCVGS